MHCTCIECSAIARELVELANRSNRGARPTASLTFDMGGAHTTWAELPDIDTRVIIVSGRVDEFGPAAIAREIAEALPNATSRHCE